MISRFLLVPSLTKKKAFKQFTKFLQYFTHCVCTSNSMGSSEIWDKYHECCIGNLPFPIQQEWYLSQISLLPMLFPVNTILAAYAHAVH